MKGLIWLEPIQFYPRGKWTAGDFQAKYRFSLRVLQNTHYSPIMVIDARINESERLLRLIKARARKVSGRLPVWVFHFANAGNAKWIFKIAGRIIQVWMSDIFRKSLPQCQNSHFQYWLFSLSCYCSTPNFQYWWQHISTDTDICGHENNTV